MDFDKAISTHADWKNKLSNYLNHPDRTLHHSEIALDNKCELGKWIEGAGKEFGTLPEFAAVKSHHANFHRIASRIVQRANAGETVSHELLLGGKSEFVAASAAVVRALMALRAKVGKSVTV